MSHERKKEQKRKMLESVAKANIEKVNSLSGQTAKKQMCQRKKPSILS